MIKKRLVSTLFLGLLVIFSLFFSQSFKNKILEISQMSKLKYGDFLVFFEQGIEDYFSQARTIDTLRQKNEELKKSYLHTIALASKLDELAKFLAQSPKLPKLEKVDSYSYVKLGDYGKVWIDYGQYENGKIYGLIYGDKTAGIATAYEGKFAGFLQNDSKCVFAVYVGNEKIPGVIFGDNQNMLIKFIPPWLEPEVGQKVYTSGLDGIFFEGLSVGKVIKVLKGDEYNSAIVEPEAKINPPSYFYLIS